MREGLGSVPLVNKHPMFCHQLFFIQYFSCALWLADTMRSCGGLYSLYWLIGGACKHTWRSWLAGDRDCVDRPDMSWSNFFFLASCSTKKI